MMANPFASPSREQIANGVACVTAQDFRWEKCHIKSTSLLGNVLARQISADVGATETILLRDGRLTEASASNVFVVKNGVVAAAPRDNLILLGITYDLLVRLAEEGAIKLEVRPISESEVRSADEIWLTSSTKEVLAVTTLDGEPVGGGKPGPLFKRMHALFQEHKAQARKARVAASESGASHDPAGILRDALAAPGPARLPHQGDRPARGRFRADDGGDRGTRRHGFAPPVDADVSLD